MCSFYLIAFCCHDCCIHVSVRSVPHPGNAAPHCTKQGLTTQRRFSLYRPAPWSVRSAFLPGWLFLHGDSSQALHLLQAAKGGGAGREASLLSVAPPPTICSGALSEVHHRLAEWRLSQGAPHSGDDCEVQQSSATWAAGAALWEPCPGGRGSAGFAPKPGELSPRSSFHLLIPFILTPPLRLVHPPTPTPGSQGTFPRQWAQPQKCWRQEFPAQGGAGHGPTPATGCVAGCTQLG